MSLLLRRPPGREAYPGDVGRPLVAIIDAFVGPQRTLQTVNSSAGCELTVAEENPVGAKTQTGQEPAHKGNGSGWQPRADSRAHDICKEMSWSIANASCRRTPGPISQATRNSTTHSSRQVLIRRTLPIKQLEDRSSIRTLSNGSACKQSFSTDTSGAKLLGICESRHTTIMVKPVNFVKHWSLAEGRGLVVPCFRSIGKEAKPAHVASQQGAAHLIQSQDWRAPSNDGSEQDSTLKVIDKLNKIGTVKGPINNLIKLLDDINIWVIAYAKLSRNPGSLTRGTDTSTIDGTSLATLTALKDQVRTGHYPWGSIRRIWIPKPGRSEKRPLGIPNFQDRLVQEVLRMVLESIYEPRFSPTSHGFRPNKGQHGCIKYIRAWFPGVTWFIEGDITKCYDTIDHDILLGLLRRRISDKKFIGLIEGGLKSKVMDCKVTLTSELGTPQGGVISPLLSNIYLHEMDRYMSRICSAIDTGKRRKPNRQYQMLSNRAYRARKAGNMHNAAKWNAAARQLESKDSMDSNYRRLRYVRYADDFLIGIIGSKMLTSRVKEALSDFLRRRLKLTLSESKTHITHHNKHIPWLGFLISCAKTITGGKARLKQRTIQQRKPSLGVVIYCDKQKMIRRLAEKGYCDKDGRSKPNWKEALQPPQSYSVARAAKLLVALRSYFKVANDNRAVTHQVSQIVRNSLAKTYAAKFKLESMRQVITRAGKDLSRSIKPEKRAIGNTDWRQMEDARKAGGKLKPTRVSLPYTLAREIPKPDIRHSFSGISGGKIRDPYTTMHNMALRAHGKFCGSCCACGSTENVEMHHVRGLKHLKGKDVTEKLIIAANRKAIPLCRPCHLRAHGKKTINIKIAQRD